MSQGQLRRQYPDSVSSFRYHFESLGSFAKIELGDSEFYLTVTPTGTGEGWCGTASGQAHRFGYAWVGDELHLWLDGHLFIYQRDVERRRNRRLGQCGGKHGTGENTAGFVGRCGHSCDHGQERNGEAGRQGFSEDQSRPSDIVVVEPFTAAATGMSALRGDGPHAVDQAAFETDPRIGSAASRPLRKSFGLFL